MEEVRAILGQMTAGVPYLRVHVDAPSEASDWLRSAPLVADPDHLLAVVRHTAAGRGTERDDIATSLFVQAYAFRVASVAIGSWLMADAVIDLSPSTMSIRLGRSRPNEVWLHEPRLTPRSDVAALHASVIENHLHPLVATAHRSCRVGEALLWANVTASCVSAFAAFREAAGTLGVATAARLDAFLAGASPEMRGAGRRVSVGSGWAWERKACCLWYQTSSGFQCDDCSRWTSDERRARYGAAVAGEASS